ncbi:hypothetical protein [Paraburkholderia sp. J8-2]|uniref:hypothetical protein n=1 Tax=Paraburkholderia sp. J8-2 TaxID=2805440 RepID=UPI002AB73BFE|nr:hypothetical protein [Paraburkholderia sp. J8-2]
MTMKQVSNKDSDADQSARQDWLPELMIGLLAVLACPLLTTLTGGLNVASHSKRIVFAVIGVLALAKAAFGVRRADAWHKSICGGLVAFGALIAVLDFVAIANP